WRSHAARRDALQVRRSWWSPAPFWTGFLHHSEIIRGAPAGPLLGRWVVLTRFRGRACRAPQLGIAWGINSRVRESTTKTGWTNTPAQDHCASLAGLAGWTRTLLQGGGRWFETTSAHDIAAGHRPWLSVAPALGLDHGHPLVIFRGFHTL